MKKVISICLAVVFVLLAFAGCSKNPETEKEELLAQAVEVNMSDINDEAEENLVRAKEKYCNKTLKVEGYISGFKDDCVTIHGKNEEYKMDVYLPTEEIVNLVENQKIVVVGTTSDKIETVTEEAYGGTVDDDYFKMPTAYLVQDKFEYMGVLENTSSTNKVAELTDGENTIFNNIISFADGVDTSTLPWNQKVTVSATVLFRADSTVDLSNVEIVEQ